MDRMGGLEGEGERYREAKRLAGPTENMRREL